MFIFERQGSEEERADQVGNEVKIYYSVADLIGDPAYRKVENAEDKQGEEYEIDVSLVALYPEVSLRGKEGEEESRAVEGRNGDHIEYREENVDVYSAREHKSRKRPDICREL